MKELQKRVWAEISLGHIEHNLAQLRRWVPEGCRCMGVVKADAYGHGSTQVAHTLEQAGADYLGVYCLDEAAALRLDGITMPILIFGHTPAQYIGDVLDFGLTQTVADAGSAAAYAQAAKADGRTLRVHIKVDTGLTRYGFCATGTHFEECVQQVEDVCRTDGLEVEGIYTHFAVSDEEGEFNHQYTLDQYALFQRLLERIEADGFHIPIRHCSNTGAIVYYPEMAMDMVRAGNVLYDLGDEEDRLGLQTTFTLKAKISAVRMVDADTYISYGLTYKTRQPERIGIVDAGYGDGLPRSISNHFRVWTKDGFAEQRGRLCMDTFMVDLTALPDVGEGDTVEIFGPHASIHELAAAAKTIPEEFYCSVTKRVPRIYIK